jgi:hypothetical protein
MRGNDNETPPAPASNGCSQPTRPADPLDGCGMLHPARSRFTFYLPPSRPNSVLKIGSHPSPLCRSLGFANVQDDVAPLFCLVGLGPAIAIKVAAPPASLVVEPAQDQSKIEPAFAPNELAKADRLELPDNPVKTEIVMPATKTMPAESPSTSPEAIKSTGPETIRLRAGIGKTPTPGSARSRRLVGTLRAKKRRKAQANPPERKS